MMSGYLDDSFNSRTIVCAGWIAGDAVWESIIKTWGQRVAYENRVSLKKGLKPVRRYHAADCASRMNEFEGWTQERQIRFVRRLQDIMVAEFKPMSPTRPMIFGWGASLKEAPDWVGDALSKTEVRKLCYRICVRDCLKEIGLLMREFHTQDTIRFFHDSGDLFPAARDGFDAACEGLEECREHFVSISKRSWEDCVPLQAADMVAYDLFRQTDKLLMGTDEVRKSMQRIVGKHTPIVSGCLKPGAFKQIREWWDRDHAKATKDS